MVRRYALTATLLLPLLWQQAAAQDDGGSQMVVINGTRSPDLQPYRYMPSGLDAFDDDHELAPKAAQVRFHVQADF